MTDPRISSKARARVERERGHRRLSFLLAVLAAAGLSAGAFAILHSSLFSARTVVIAGAVHTPRSEILKVSGLDREPPLIDVNSTVMENRIDRLPWVLHSTVHVVWPSTVSVLVVERVAVATEPAGRGRFSSPRCHGAGSHRSGPKTCRPAARRAFRRLVFAGPISGGLDEAVVGRGRTPPCVSSAPRGAHCRLPYRRDRAVAQGGSQGRRG